MFEESYILELEGKEFVLSVDNRGAWKRTNEMVGQTVDGFIGMNILYELGSIVFDKGDMTVSFGEDIAGNENSTEIVVSSMLNALYITIPVNANGRKIDAIFDTGAMINYINGGVEHVNEIFDYNPKLGDIHGYSGPLEVTVGNGRYTLDFGDMSAIPIMMMYAKVYQMFLGINGLFDHRFELNLRDGFVNLD